MNGGILQSQKLRWIAIKKKKKNAEFLICHIHNYTEYNQQWNVFSAFNPSKCIHTLGAVSRRCGARGAVFGVWCLAQGCHLSRGWFLPELRFEPTTSGYKSNALSIRPRLPCTISRLNSKFQISNKIWNELTNECCFLCSNSLFFRLDQPMRMRSSNVLSTMHAHRLVQPQVYWNQSF